MKNLITAYRKCEPQSVIDGMNWYRIANEFCGVLAGQYECSKAKVAAILSALSPGTNYEQNKNDTAKLFELMTGRIQSHKFMTWGANVRKAKSIFQATGNYLDFFSPKTGPKTYNFYLNITNPQGNDVTVDRHAYRIATGEEYKSLTPKQYNIIADLYRAAAKKLNILPLELQAVLWIDYRVKQKITFKEYQYKDCPF